MSPRPAWTAPEPALLKGSTPSGAHCTCRQLRAHLARTPRPRAGKHPVQTEGAAGGAAPARAAAAAAVSATQRALRGGHVPSSVLPATRQQPPGWVSELEERGTPSRMSEQGIWEHTARRGAGGPPPGAPRLNLGHRKTARKGVPPTAPGEDSCDSRHKNTEEKAENTQGRRTALPAARRVRNAEERKKQTAPERPVWASEGCWPWTFKLAGQCLMPHTGLVCPQHTGPEQRRGGVVPREDQGHRQAGTVPF